MTSEEEKIVLREQLMLNDLFKTIKSIKEDEHDLNLIQQSIRQLEELFLIVVVGEFNAGKSSFINSLLGSEYLKIGITPTTTKLHVIRYGSDFRNHYNEFTNQMNLELPLEWLKVNN